MSGYLLLSDKFEQEKSSEGYATPIFMGHGVEDDIVKYEWGIKTKQILEEYNYKLTWKEYADLAHSINSQEIIHLSEFINQKS